MKEPIVKNEIKQKLKELKKELQQLEQNKNPSSSMSKNDSNDLEYLKATAEMKRRIQLRGLIRNLMRDLYKNGTDPFVEDLTDSSDLPEFSWGINEKEESDREIIFEKTGNDEYIRVTNYGKFEYMTGKSGVSIENIPDSNHVTIDVEHFIRYGDQIRIFSNDINEAIARHPEYLGERLNLLRITKGMGGNQRDYFILSPIQQQQLQDEEIRKVFIDEYCSDIYLDSVVTGENGIYAGNIVKEQDGFCAIRYAKSSVRAAKLAELLTGTAQLHVKISEGNIRKLPGIPETFRQIRERFVSEIIKKRQQESASRNNEEERI